MTRRRPARPRGGYTLLEMVAVVTIVAIAAAITIPGIQAMLADGRREAAGDQIRARLADARALAMAHGKPFRVGFVANAGHFQVAPDDDPAWDAVDPTPIDEDELIRGELPENVVFCLTESDLVGQAGPPTAGGGWETAAVFLPDGSAEEDVTFFYGKAGYQPTGVRVRGLTGAVTVFDPAAEERRP